jgi:hypothetical protein
MKANSLNQSSYKRSTISKTGRLKSVPSGKKKIVFISSNRGNTDLFILNKINPAGD